MDFELNETERMLQDTMIRIREGIAGQEIDTQWAACAEAGLQGASVPEEFGGFGLGLIGAMLIAEQLGASCAALNWQRDAVLPAIALTALAQAGNGRPLDDFLSGARYQMGAGQGDMTRQLRLVEGAGATTLELVEDGAVTRVDLLPKVDADLQIAAEVTAAADHLGAIQHLFDMTLDYTRTRQQFGRPLSSFQALQHRVVDMSIAVDESRALIMAAGMAATEGLPEAARLATAAWSKVRKNGQRVAEEAIQLHGGIAMTAEYPVGDYVKRLIRNAHSLTTASRSEPCVA